MKKKQLNKKVLLGVLSIIVCLAIIIVTSFCPLIIDPTKWMTKSFLTNELIIVAIVIFSMVSVMFMGQASNGANPNSEIAKAKREFAETIKLITNYNAFFQWIKKVQQPYDVRQIQEREMRKLGIEDFSVLKLEISEIKALAENPQKYGDKFYKQITKEQAKGLIYIKTKLKIELVEPSYYLTYRTNDADKTITEKSGNESKKKASVVSLSVITKIVITILIAMIFTSLVMPEEDGSSGITSAYSWLLFISRLSAMISSAYMGFMVGSQMNDIDADYIEMRCLVHRKFAEDKDFKPLTQQEEAKEQFKERVKEENKILMIGGSDYGRNEEN